MFVTFLHKIDILKNNKNMIDENFNFYEEYNDLQLDIEESLESGNSLVPLFS